MSINEHEKEVFLYAKTIACLLKDNEGIIVNVDEDVEDLHMFIREEDSLKYFKIKRHNYNSKIDPPVNTVYSINDNHHTDRFIIEYLHKALSIALPENANILLNLTNQDNILKNERQYIYIDRDESIKNLVGGIVKFTDEEKEYLKDYVGRISIIPLEKTLERINRKLSE
jgi:hypothetical protein